MLTVTELLHVRFQLYVPEARGRDLAFEQKLGLLAGGFTQQVSWGTWRNNTGDTLSERVVIYEVMCSRAQSGPVQEAIEGEVHRLLEDGEEAVLLVKDGIGNLYSFTNPFKEVPHGNQS